MATYEFTAAEVDQYQRHELSWRQPGLRLTVHESPRGFIVWFSSGLFPVIISRFSVVHTNTLGENARQAGLLALDEYVPVLPRAEVYPPYEEFMQATLDALRLVDHPREMVQALRALPMKLPTVFLERKKITDPSDRYQYRRHYEGLVMSLYDAMVELFESDTDAFDYAAMHRALRQVHKHIPRLARYGEAQTVG